MKTTLIIYIALWVLTVIPLITFNIKRMRVKNPPDPPHVNVRFTVIICVLAVFITGFLFMAYKDTINTRYEIAAERYITQHAEYLVGNTDEKGFLNSTKNMRTDSYDTSGLSEVLGKSGSAKTAKFQIGSWIIPKYYKDNPHFPKAEVKGDQNPVYLVYLMVADGKREDYIIRMTRNKDLSWKIDYQGIATNKEMKVAASGMPSEINGKWYTVAKK